VEELNSFEEIKKAMKQLSRKRVDFLFEKHWSGVEKVIDEVTNKVATSASDEARMEEVAKVARNGATLTGIASVTGKIVQEVLSENQSELDRIGFAVNDMLKNLFSEAVAELVVEKLKKKGLVE